MFANRSLFQRDRRLKRAAWFAQLVLIPRPTQGIHFNQRYLSVQQKGLSLTLHQGSAKLTNMDTKSDYRDQVKLARQG
jgi:hypothetical protein